MVVVSRSCDVGRRTQHRQHPAGCRHACGGRGKAVEQVNVPGRPVQAPNNSLHMLNKVKAPRCANKQKQQNRASLQAEAGQELAVYKFQREAEEAR